MAENTNQQGEGQSKSKKLSAGILFIIILLVGLLGFMSWLYIDQKQTTQQITRELSAEKDSLQSELKTIRVGYDSLQTDNDTLNEQLDQEKERIDNLLSEIRQVKATNYTRIKELKDEVSTLRKIAKSYVRQIDSLNQANKKLRAENQRVRQQIQQVEQSKQQLEQEKDSLTETVNKAKVLRAENISATPINDRGKEKHKVNKINKIKVCFTIEENVVAKPGDKYAYIRIAAPPEGFILTNSEDNLFDFNGKKMVYSARRPFEYTGKATDMCVYFDSKGELKPGEYDVYIFADGYEIGNTSFKLEESGWLFF
jgi:peptidoglycan hydrolase CwlO-like protein